MRDPRVNPKPTDIIRFGGIFGAVYHEVLPHDPRMGTTDVSSFSDGVETTRSILQWRIWAHNAEIIRCIY